MNGKNLIKSDMRLFPKICEPLTIIRLKGQLGNQLFQYALYYSIKKRGVKCKIDAISGGVKNALTCLGLDVEYANEDEIRSLLDERRDLYSRIKRRLFGKKPKVIVDNFGFNPKVYEPGWFLDGYWQSPRYFNGIPLIAPPPAIYDNKYFSTVEEMEQCCSVSIHVRRGDYLNFPDLYPNLCNGDYYNRAIEFITQKCLNPKFYVFSDDIEWCRSYFKGDSFVFVDWNKREKYILDLFLMSNCKHNIIANSTFSWWSAYLNSNVEKIVVAPSTWLYCYDAKDIYCDEWIRIDI